MCVPSSKPVPGHQLARAELVLAARRGTRQPGDQEPASEARDASFVAPGKMPHEERRVRLLREDISKDTMCSNEWRRTQITRSLDFAVWRDTPPLVFRALLRVQELDRDRIQ